MFIRVGLSLLSSALDAVGNVTRSGREEDQREIPTEYKSQPTMLFAMKLKLLRNRMALKSAVQNLASEVTHKAFIKPSHFAAGKKI